MTRHHHEEAVDCRSLRCSPRKIDTTYLGRQKKSVKQNKDFFK